MRSSGMKREIAAAAINTLGEVQGSVLEDAPIAMTGQERAMEVVLQMRAAAARRQAEGSVLSNPDYVVGRQTPPGHWMDRQVELLRQERLAIQDTNQHQGEQ